MCNTNFCLEFFLILLAIQGFNSSVFSQNCQSECPELILNGGFESWTSNPSAPFFDGFAGFTLGQVEDWPIENSQSNPNTPDLISPSVFTSLSSFLPSTVGATCYFGAPGHHEELYQQVSIFDDPVLTYSLSFDYAAACLTGFTDPVNAQILPQLEGGSIRVFTDNVLQETVDINQALEDGFSNQCILIDNSQQFSNILLQTTTGGASVDNYACLAYFDNVSLKCDLNDPDLFVSVGKDGNISFYNVASTTGNVPNIVSYNWRFSDGSTSTDAFSIKVDAEDGLVACVDIIDDRGCCATLCNDYDLYIKDGDSDDGTEGSGVVEVWASPDIWVRNEADGFDNQTTQSLCFDENINNPDDAIRPVYVYVRVRNRGSSAHQRVQRASVI